MSAAVQPPVPSAQPAKPVVVGPDVTKNPFGDIKPEDYKITQRDWDYLAAAIHHIRVDVHDMGFFGAMLQTIMIDFTNKVPTACISFRPEKKQFLIELSAPFFRLLTMEERMAILLHEVYHMTHSHLTRIPALQDRKKANKCADCAINQIIPGIPTRKPIRGVFPEDYGQETDKTLEHYYENWPEPQDGDGEGDGQDEGDGQGGGGGGQGECVDVHNWDPNIEESDVLEGMDDVIKRTMVKTNTSFSELPGSIRDVLEDIEKRRKTIDWKKQIKMFLRRHTLGIEKVFTRTRPSKRYEYASPGLKLGELPKLLILLDTSGSMSVIEVNAMLDQVDQIIKIGARTVQLGLWNSSLYSMFKYKRGSRDFAHKQVQSGSTDFAQCAELISKSNFDAVIVGTDGFFSDTQIKVKCPILFVISDGGAAKLPTTYPMQRMVKLPNMGES